MTEQEGQLRPDERAPWGHPPCRHGSLRLLSITGDYVCAECGDVITIERHPQTPKVEPGARAKIATGL